MSNKSHEMQGYIHDYTTDISYCKNTFDTYPWGQCEISQNYSFHELGHYFIISVQNFYLSYSLNQL